MNSNTPSNTPPDAASSLTVGAGRLLCYCSRCATWITRPRVDVHPFTRCISMRCNRCDQPMQVIDLVRDPN